jgi:hypothetical protein
VSGDADVQGPVWVIGWTTSWCSANWVAAKPPRACGYDPDCSSAEIVTRVQAKVPIELPISLVDQPYPRAVALENGQYGNRVPPSGQTQQLVSASLLSGIHNLSLPQMHVTGDN